MHKASRESASKPIMCDCAVSFRRCCSSRSEDLRFPKGSQEIFPLPHAIIDTTTHASMKHRVLSAIARPVVKNASQPWLCRRCLAQQATHANNSNQTPLILDSKSLTPESRRDSSTTAATAPAQDTNGESLSPQRRHKLTGKAKKRQLFLEGKLATTPDPERRAALWRTLKQELPHAIPPQYLIHVRRSILPPKDRHEQQHLFKWALEGYSNGEGGRKSEHAREIKGVVVSAGKMDRTVKVKVPWQRWEQKIRKVSIVTSGWR